jgi:hypothetical protein
MSTPTPLQPLRSFSFGGGVQSVACLVLAAQGRIDFPTMLFANVGADSEHPGTLAYLETYAKPYATAHGINLIELHRTLRDGTPETLYGRLTKEGSRSLPIPVRMSNGAPGTRSCTADFKIRVVGKWLKTHGANAHTPATVGIGISLDEIQRANTRRQEPHERITYPLLDLGLRRADCHRIITGAGLPVPPKSACWFCPFHRPTTWADMRRDEPELFERSCQLEALLIERCAALGKDPVYLTRYGKPLNRAIPGGQLTLFDTLDPDSEDALCDSGRCFT